MKLRTAPAKPTLGIIGLGAFGQLMAANLKSHFQIFAIDKIVQAAEVDGIKSSDLAGVCACDIVVLAVPVSELKEVCSSMAPLLRPGTIVMDVGSVKVEPSRIMVETFPEHVDIIATHPMFGPQSIAAGTRGLKVVLCPVRSTRTGRVAAFLRGAFGLKVIVTSPEQHDREAAMTQGLTHLIAKTLLRLEPPRQITTRSFDLIWEAVSMVRHDAAGVSDAIEARNPYAGIARRAFFEQLDAVTAELTCAGESECDGVLQLTHG